MAQATLLPLVDRALGGRGSLRRRLKQARKAGETHETIARKLEAEGIQVSRETVRKWCIELDVEQDRAS